MRWAKTSAGKVIPMDATPSADGGWVYDSTGIVRYIPAAERAGKELYTSHFATCPFADQHRREK